MTLLVLAAAAADREFLWRNRYLLSPAVTPGRFSADGLGARLEENLRLLATPAGSVLRRILPAKVAYFLVRWKNVLLSMFIYWLSKAHPRAMKRLVAAGIRQQMGRDYPLKPDFAPRYNPWDQRLCLVPDGDLFKALRGGRASIVTDTIDTFTENGIALKSGRQVEADLIVRTRLHRLSLAEAGAAHNLKADTARKRRDRGEVRLLAWIAEEPLPSRHLAARAVLASLLGLEANRQEHNPQTRKEVDATRTSDAEHHDGRGRRRSRTRVRTRQTKGSPHSA